MKIKLSRVDDKKMDDRLFELYGIRKVLGFSPDAKKYKTTYPRLRTHYMIDCDCPGYWEIEICKM